MKTRLTRSQSKRSPYSPKRAGRFWNRRVSSTDPLSAVLTYDAPPIINKAYDRWERGAVSLTLGTSLRRIRALDLGAGTGRISLLLASKGATVTSIDVSEKMLSQLTKAARTSGLSSKIRPILSSATRLPIPDDSIDLITCCGLLEHLPARERRSAMGEALRVLTPSGRMIVVINNTDCVFLRRRYPMKTQRPDGYFVGLVGLSWLRRWTEARGLIVTIRAANPWYACAYYLASSGDRRDTTLSPLTAAFRGLADIDLNIDLDSPLVTKLASHLVVEIAYS